MSRHAAVIAMLGLCLGMATAQGSGLTVQGAGVRIISPPGHRAETIDMALADFGKPLYGGALTGRLIYPSEDPSYNLDGKKHRCGSTECQYGCTQLKDASPPFEINKGKGESIIMLVDRGPRGYGDPCYFLTKAFTAQQSGADALLVADDVDGPMTTAIPPEEEDVAVLLKDLTISAALISKADGQKLKDLLKDQTLVRLSLNWTNLEPRSQKVSWELWTSTNDQCGTLCEQQAEFIKQMKPWAQQLEEQGLASFSPHYIIWSCPIEYSDTPECSSECILSGTYCSPDPDGSMIEGYSGADVLSMNLHSLCFSRLAKEDGRPWLWWDYAERFNSDCKSSTKQYTVDCARKVFDEVDGGSLLKNRGREYWDACINSGNPASAPGNTTLTIFEEKSGSWKCVVHCDMKSGGLLELDLQMGYSGALAQVSILPTVRINGQQYRGSLAVSGVMRAICSGFPAGSEPPVCNEQWVSENECQVDGPGYKQCKVDDPNANGHNRCINTFESYKCECGDGWTAAYKADTGEMVCEDVNECLATNIMLTDPKCSCDRCACLNKPGSYECTGPQVNKCTQEYNFGGCWYESVEGQIRHACKDNIVDFKRLAARGTPPDKWWTCECPPCFQPVAGTDQNNPKCTKMCPLSQCQNGMCVAPGDSTQGNPASGGGGGGASGKGVPTKGGMSGGMVFFVIIIAVAATAGGMYAMYHYVLRQRMEGEIRDIMSQYMPLDNGSGRNNRRGGGGAFGGLRPVEEMDEREDAPLMAPAGLPNAGSRPASQPAQQPAAASQRNAFGSLAMPGNGVGSFPTSSYKPPAVSSDVEEGRHVENKETTRPVNDTPLLGDGPL